VIRSLPGARALLALAVGALALSGCADAADAPAATIGTATVSDEQLEIDMNAFRFLVGLSGAPCGTPVAGETEEAACARFTLTQDIQEELVKAYAAANDLSSDPADVEGAISQLEENLGGPEGLDAQLLEAGITRADLRALADRLILFGAVQDAIVGERLDEDDLRALYEGSLGQFTSVEVSHILVDTRAQAQDIAAEATQENFARLARQHSLDTSAPTGGSLGTFSETEFLQQFDPTFAQAALALQPGEISGAVHTQFGYHVIELVRRDVATFDQVREQLSAQQGPQIFQEWMQEQFEATDIEVNPRYGRLDDATGEVLAIRSTEESPTATPAAPTGPTNTAP
jgi:parvulin-like peptidyl-prolyl isomerase